METDDVLQALERINTGTRAWSAARWNADGGVKAKAMREFNGYLVRLTAELEDQEPQQIPDLGAQHLALQFAVVSLDLTEVADKLTGPHIDELTERLSTLRDTLF